MNHFLESAKAYAALVGAIVTALLAGVPPHSTLFLVLTGLAAAATAIATYAVPNKPKAPAVEPPAPAAPPAA